MKRQRRKFSNTRGLSSQSTHLILSSKLNSNSLLPYPLTETIHITCKCRHSLATLSLAGSTIVSWSMWSYPSKRKSWRKNRSLWPSKRKQLLIRVRIRSSPPSSSTSWLREPCRRSGAWSTVCRSSHTYQSFKLTFQHTLKAPLTASWRFRRLRSFRSAGCWSKLWSLRMATGTKPWKVPWQLNTNPTTWSIIWALSSSFLSGFCLHHPWFSFSCAHVKASLSSSAKTQPLWGALSAERCRWGS